ncbi:MAG: GtrA family protein [Candidatus Kuenenbacteria bacterium]
MLQSFFNKILQKFRSHPYIKKNPGIKELIKYSIVGNFANIMDFIFYISLTRAFTFWRAHYLTANIITMLTASIIRFALHKKWTFRNSDKDIKYQYLKFIILLISTMFASEAGLYLAVEQFNIHDIIGKLLSILLITFFAFSGTKLWVFKKQKLSSRLEV